MRAEARTFTRHNNISNIEIFNLSTYKLSAIERLTLGLGLKFIPTPFIPKHVIRNSLDTSISSLERKLDIAMYFSYDTNTVDKSIPINTTNPSTWRPPQPQPWSHELKEYISTTRQKIHLRLKSLRTRRDDTDTVIIETLKKLRNNKNIVIKPADKNLGLVILNCKDYETMCLKHLNDQTTYRICNFADKDLENTYLFAELRTILATHNKLITYPKSNILSKLASSLLQLQHSKLLRYSPFYCLPKLHKRKEPPYDGRPIVSSLNSATYATSRYIDNLLKPLLSKLPTVCTSSSSVILDMHEMNNNHILLTPDAVIATADVTSLYPSIPIPAGLNAVRNTCLEFNHCIPILDFIIELLEWVLRNNFCIFKDTIYLQLTGTAMGTPCAPTYANIFLYQLEKSFIQHSIYYRRYLDDLYYISLNITLAELIINGFNAAFPSINLDAVNIGRSGIFLDLELSITDTGSISHKLYQKAANKYAYIPPTSAHDKNIFKNLVSQELIRYSISCTNSTDFNNLLSLFSNRLSRRGYPANAVPLAQATLLPRPQLIAQLLETRNNRANRINIKPSPTVFLDIPPQVPNPRWKPLFKVSNDLSNLVEFKDAFSSPDVVIAKRNQPNISSYIISSEYKSNR